MRQHIRAGNFDPADLLRLESTMVVSAYNRGDKIFSQGTKAMGIYCLRSGHALLWHEDSFQYKTAFRVVGHGEMMGYRSMFGEDTHQATAQALTPCDICYYPKEILMQLIEEFPNFARRFFQTLARDRGPRDGLLLRGQHISVRIRLVNLLLLLMENEPYEDDGAYVLKLPMLRRDIAALLSARPESVARAIKELQQEGVAKFNGRTVTIPALDILYKEAHQEQPPLVSNASF